MLDKIHWQYGIPYPRSSMPEVSSFGMNLSNCRLWDMGGKGEGGRGGGVVYPVSYDINVEDLRLPPTRPSPVRETKHTLMDITPRAFSSAGMEPAK